MKIREKADARGRIHYRIRKKVQGTEARPRMSVFRSLKHMYVQVIDDTTGRTLAAATTREDGHKNGSNKKGAAELGKLIATRCREKGIESVVFDRGGFKYHGRIQVLADSARKAGLRI